MSRILCIGDSNTYGYDPRSFLGDRYPEEVRWTGLLQKAGWEIQNCGQNGREIPAREAQFASFAQMLREERHWTLSLSCWGQTICCSIPGTQRRMWQRAWRRFCRISSPLCPASAFF